jgi:hypothetical protein
VSAIAGYQASARSGRLADFTDDQYPSAHSDPAQVCRAYELLFANAWIRAWISDSIGLCMAEGLLEIRATEDIKDVGAVNP